MAAAREAPEHGQCRAPQIVPASHTLRLQQAATAASSTTLKSVAEGTHNDTWMKAGEAYFDWLAEFILLNAPPPALPPAAGED